MFITEDILLPIGFKAVFSGMFGNWLVGMAAEFANMGYFSFIMVSGAGSGWYFVIIGNLLPTDIGNIIGGIFLVVLAFWEVLFEEDKKYLDTQG